VFLQTKPQKNTAPDDIVQNSIRVVGCTDGNAEGNVRPHLTRKHCHQIETKQGVFNYSRALRKGASELVNYIWVSLSCLRKAWSSTPRYLTFSANLALTPFRNQKQYRLSCYNWKQFHV